MHIFPGHTAVQSIFLSTDRAVDPALLSAAYAIDAAAALKTRAALADVRVGRITIKRHIVIALMAQEIIRLAGSGCVSLDDFRRLGLSDAQIVEYRDEAFAQAAAERPSIRELLEGGA